MIPESLEEKGDGGLPPRACCRLYRSVVSGLWYKNRGAAGDIDAVEYHGHRISQGRDEPEDKWIKRADMWLDLVSSDNS